MTTAETTYSFAQPFPQILQAGRINRVEMRVSRSGSIITPSSATYQLTAPDGTDKVATTAATITNGVATYVIPASAVDLTAAHVTLGGGWREVWVFTFSDSSTRTVDRAVELARIPIQPPVADGDMTSRYPMLPALRGTMETSGQAHLDNAWAVILRRWARESGKSYLVKSAEQLFDTQLNLALAFQFAAIAVNRKESVYEERSKEHHLAYEAEWGRIVVLLDEDHDGTADDPNAMQRHGVVINPGGTPADGAYSYRSLAAAGF